MKSLFTNNGAKGFVNAGAFCLALIGFIFLLVSNGIAGYSLQHSIWSFGLEAVAIVTLCAGIVLTGKSTLASDILVFIGFICISVVVALTISDRVVLASGLFTWDPNNELGWRAYNTAVTSVVLNLVAEAALIIGAFLQGSKERQPRVAVVE